MSTNGSKPLLEVEGLVASYPVGRGLVGAAKREPKLEVHAVDGVSFSLSRGEMLALVGESGCGKTSTAQSVLRLIETSGGSIRFDGEEITGLSSKALRPLRRRMQIVYQDPYESLDPRFRVGATIEEPLEVHKIGSKKERREEVKRALELAGLTPAELYIDRYPHELSGGQRQRVAIAASLVLGPELLVADEPVSMLDVSVRAGILSILDELRDKGLAVLMITHDLSTAAHYADRIAVMYLGRIVEEGPTREVIENPQHPYTRALLSVVPKRDPRDRGTPQILRGETPNSIHIPPGCRFNPRCPIAIAECKTVDPELRRPAARPGSTAPRRLHPRLGLSPAPDQERDHGRDVGDRLEVDPLVDPVQVLAGRPVADRLALEEAEVGRGARGIRAGPPAAHFLVAVAEEPDERAVRVEGVAARAKAAELDLGGGVGGAHRLRRAAPAPPPAPCGSESRGARRGSSVPESSMASRPRAARPRSGGTAARAPRPRARDPR